MGRGGTEWDGQPVALYDIRDRRLWLPGELKEILSQFEKGAAWTEAESRPDADNHTHTRAHTQAHTNQIITKAHTATRLYRRISITDLLPWRQ